MSAWNEVAFAGDDDAWASLVDEARSEVQAEQRRRDALNICRWADENRDDKGYKLTQAEWLGARLAANSLYHRATIEWDERGAA